MQATHRSRIITALEAAWAAIRERHPEIPPAVIITGSGGHQKGAPEGYALNRHHCPERWVTGASQALTAEVFVAGELLAKDGAAVVETLLHEAAHALATARGIKDTSAAGRQRAATPAPARQP
jgi:hypothetical protein